TVAVQVAAITTTAPGTSPSAVCDAQKGSTVQPGGALVCRFSVASYATTAGTDVVTTVAATASEAGQAGNSVMGTATSTVHTSGEHSAAAVSPRSGSLQILSAAPAPAAGELPNTGTASAREAAFGLLLVGAGLAALG